MRIGIIAGLAVGVLAACATAPPPVIGFGPAPEHGETPYSPKCVDSVGRYMNMDFAEFDQTIDAGWRTVARTDGCKGEAARLIAHYRSAQSLQDARGLFWHEAQLRAEMGETELALELFRMSYALEQHLAQEGDSADLLYSRATIAFLEGDLTTLTASRDALARTPKPEGWDASIDAFRRTFPDREPPSWPTNLAIVDALIKCFGKTYWEGYSRRCRQDGE